MKTTRRTARINVKLLVTLALGIVILGLGGLVGHRFRKRVMADSALTAGNAAWERSDFAEASKQLRQYLGKFPDDPAVLERYAEANLAIRPIQPEKIGAAIGAYRRLLRQRPDDPRIWKELVKVYSGAGQHNEAAYICRQRLEVAANDPEALFWLGKALLSQRKFEESTATLSRLEALAAQDAGVRRRQVQACGLLSALALQEGDSTSEERARKWLDQAIAKHPESSEAKVQRARYFRASRRDEASAQSDLEAAERLTPHDPSVILSMADEWMHWGKPDRARAAVQSLHNISPADLERFEIDPEAWTFARYSTSCRLALLEKNYDEGSVLVESALAELRDFRRLSFLPLAIELYTSSGRFGEARRGVDEYRKGLEERTDVSESMRDQSGILAASLADAEQDWLSVIGQLDGVAVGRLNSARAWELLWRAYDKTGQNRRALHALEEFVSRSRNDAQALKALAKAYRERDWSRVVSYAGHAERLKPDDLEAKVLRLEGQIKTATVQTGGGTVLKAVAEELQSLIESHPRSGALRTLQAGVAFRQGHADQAASILESAIQNCDADPVVDLALVNLAAQSEDKTLALSKCRDAIQRHPQVASPRLRLAELLAETRAPGDALQALSDATSPLVGEEKAKVTLALAQQFIQQGETTRAAQTLQSLAVERPHDVRPRTALLALPQIQQNEANAQAVIEDLKRIEGEKRGTLWRLEQAKLWVQNEAAPQDRLDAAEELLNHCLTGDPTWSAAGLVLGRLYERRGRLDAAESLYRRFVDSSRNEFEAARRLLQLLERQDRFSDAEQILARLPQGIAGLQEHRLLVALGQGEHATALEEVNRQIAGDPNNAQLLVLKAGLVHALDKDARAAMALLDAARNFAPDAVDVDAAQASILRSEGRDDEARAVLDALVDRRKDAAAYLIRARHLVSSDRKEDAEHDFVRAAELDDKGSEGHLALAQFYSDQGNTRRAIEVYEQGLRAHAGNGEIRRGLVTALLRSPEKGHRDRGKMLLNELRSQAPDDTRLLVTAAESRLKDGTPDGFREAFGLLERVVTLDPRNVPAHVRLIELAQQRGDRREAEALISRAMGANPGDVNLQLVRAGLEAESGNHGASRELARSVLEGVRRLPASEAQEPAARRRLLGACTLLADLAARAGDWDAAQAYAAEAVRAEPRSDLARMTQARVLDSAGRTAEAINELEAYRQTDAGRANAALLTQLAEYYRRKPDFAAAELILREAESLAPGSAAVTLTRLRVLASQKKWSDIASQLSAESEAADPRVTLLGAALLTESGDSAYLRLAQESCDRVVARHPDRIDARITRAQVAYHRHELPLCEQEYRHVLQAEPYHAQALNDLSWILAVDLNRPEEALPFADKGALRFPDDPHLLDTRGVIMALLNRPGDARRDFERCLTLPNQPPASRARTLFQLGRILATQGEASLARERLREAQSLDARHSIFTEAEKTEIRDILGS